MPRSGNKETLSAEDRRKLGEAWREEVSKLFSVAEDHRGRGHQFWLHRRGVTDTDAHCFTCEWDIRDQDEYPVSNGYRFQMEPKRREE
jgi:hypothetical protein